MMLLTALLVLFLARQANRAEAQRRAVGLIEATEGGVGYADDQVNEPGFCALSPYVKSGPNWLPDLIGEDYFRTVTVAGFHWQGWDDEQFDPIPDGALRSLLDLSYLTTLRIDHRTLNGEQLAFIGSLPSLEVLEITDCIGFNGNALVSFGNLKKLRVLSLRTQEITDDLLKSIASLRALEELTLTKSLASLREDVLEGVTNVDFTLTDGSGLGPLSKLPRFRKLLLSSPNLGDSGMEEIGRFQHLQELIIGESPFVTDDGLRAIANLRDLERLCLFDLATVTDGGISHLGRMNALRDLTLDNLPGITDTGISHLGGLKKLQSLSLRQLRIDGSTLAELAELEHLAHLSLGDTPISDNGLLAAAAIRSVKGLGVFRVATTDGGVSAFKALRPDLAGGPDFYYAVHSSAQDARIFSSGP
ncbi:MAG: hypothetical protein U0800_11245 [Isosphaeraceae bacterium]